jgi:hypothetical protein
MEAGWHLLRSGETLRGARLLADAATEVAWRGDGLQAAAAPLEAALEVYRAEGRPVERCVELLVPLVLGGQAFDRRLVVRHGPAAFAAIRKASGLETASRLQPLLGGRLGLYAGLARATARFLALPDSERRQGVRATLIGSFSAAVALVGSAVGRFDTDEAERIVQGIRPLEAFGRGHPGRFVYDFCDALLTVSRGLDGAGREKLHALLERLQNPRLFAGLPGSARQQFQAGILFLLGVGDAYLGGGLARARELETLGLSVYKSNAELLRALHFAHRGQLDLADRCIQAYEAQATGSVTALLEITMPHTLGTIHRLTGDVVGLRAAVEQLDYLVEDIPSVAEFRDLTKAAWLASIGDLEASCRLYQELVERDSRRTFTGWVPALGLYASVLNELGLHARARDACERVLGALTESDLSRYTFHDIVRRERAVAEAGLGSTHEACARLDALVHRGEHCWNPLATGLAHRDRALVALRMGDRSGFERHRDAMAEWFRSTRNPALVAQCERLSLRNPVPGALSSPDVMTERIEVTVPRGRARSS